MKIIKKPEGFSLVELMLSLIIISLIAAAFTPVITKKLKTSTITAGSITQIKTDCSSIDDKCKLCTKSYCIQCDRTCLSNQYADPTTCKCIDCTKYGSDCSQCNSEKCTKCPSEDYYMEGNTCLPCPDGYFCDGSTKSNTCPSGYYCDSKGKHLCSEKFTGCSTCNESVCLSCNAGYRITNGACEKCADGNCFYCPDDKNICTNCNCGQPVNGKCVNCSTTMPNCLYCSSLDVCTSCNGGYFIDSNHKCSLCTKENCVTCKNGTTSDNQECDTCTPGYYKASDGSCKLCSAIFSNCSLCDGDKCLTCNQGYILSDDSKSCTLDPKNEFKCSDENFMKIGNLCFTRRNMGDSSDLTIPSDIRIRSAGESCPSNYMKCCWKDSGGNCNSNNGSYSGCNRTVCNWAAANAICASFNYSQSGWRVPTFNELYAVKDTTDSLGDNGLQLCLRYQDTSTFARCDGIETQAYYYDTPSKVWSSDTLGSFSMQTLCNHAGVFYNYDMINSAAASVRCVLDMSD